MTSPDFDGFLNALSSPLFEGEIRSDWASRIVWSTDNSIYQLIPHAIIFPKTPNDIVQIGCLLARPEWQSITISPRGGGTGTNGQSLTEGLILDTSKYMNHVLEINPTDRWVRVQPGVVLDQLNAALAPHQLTFVPNVAPSNRATIGGMISTDASGKGSRIYGKTSQHILELTVVTAAGNTLILSPHSDSPINDILNEIATQDRDEIRHRFPTMSRFLSGYNLDHATTDGINPIPIFAGSEGSLGFIVEAKLGILPKPAQTQLVIIQYHSLMDAVSDAQSLIPYDPVAIETIDKAIIETGRTDMCFEPLAQWVHSEAGAINLVELANPAPLMANSHNALSIRMAASSTEATQWWTLRKKAVGLLANSPGRAKPVPFVEDTVVPPQNLAAYISEFRDLLDRHHLHYAMYGHADVGCVHVRPALDLQDPRHGALIRQISDEVHHLVSRYGGLIWGEHGKGFRTDYIMDVFGPRLYRRMQEIKTRLDPHGQLNPGKMVPPLTSTVQQPGIDAPRRAQNDEKIRRTDQDQWPAVMACNGNGTCFSVMPTSLMCPSYLSTGDRVHSPKGRAMIFKEWIRQKKSDTFSQDVHNAMSGCLACKACVSECPVHVNIPQLKSHFLAHYHRSHPRPLRDYLVAHVETLSYIGSKWRIIRWLSRMAPRQFAGLTDFPILKKPPQMAPLRTPNSATVVILVDAFTAAYAPNIATATHTVLSRMGFTPHLLPLGPSGKPAYIKGFRTLFQRQGKQVLDRLTALGETPVVIIDPSLSSMFSDEYTEISTIAVKPTPIAQFLNAHKEKLPSLSAQQLKATLFPHCMERSGPRATIASWNSVLTHVGFQVTLGDIGCCGMAGTFGHEVEHASQSKAIFNLSWGPTIAKSDLILVTGFSCRHQVYRCTTTPPRHPLEAIADAL